MKLDPNMAFPHPVLSPGTTDYRGQGFGASFEYALDGEDGLSISATITLECPDLLRLIDEGHARSGFFLICRETYIDRCIDSPIGASTHNLKASDYSGRIALRPVIWSVRAKPNWRPASVHPEFGDSLDLSNASVLAFGDEATFSLDRQRLKPFESIFNLAAKDGLRPGLIEVDVENESVTLFACHETKLAIEEIRNSSYGREVLLNALYLPAVMQVLQEVAEEPGRCEQYRWFRVFEAKCAAAGVLPSNRNYLADAQKLLAYPFTRVEANRERLFA